MENKLHFEVAPLILLIVILGLFIPPNDETPQPEEEVLLPIHLDIYHLTTPAVSGIYNLPEKPNLNPPGKLFFEDFKPRLDEVTLPTCDIVMESIGSYYVTNYCPAECGGSWATSSGATCHRSSYKDRLTIPTTCAIDLSVNDYGDLFYIPAFDRVFIAEDIGSGVKSKWLDLFYEDYADVVNFPVGYYEVYSVEYVYGEVPASNYDILEYMDQEFEDALTAYNHEPYADVSILMMNPTPFKKRIIINIDIKDYEKQPKVIPYI